MREPGCAQRVLAARVEARALAEGERGREARAVGGQSIRGVAPARSGGGAQPLQRPARGANDERRVDERPLAPIPARRAAPPGRAAPGSSGR